ncbi:hypothetical protein OS493_013697 [Desmophyllum pertusum]|uniref:Uncharacterized protein n=1 Tax=Desmophyllum pertusum TaxID=174260 RepID=A0A9W9ZPZ6_9CNID|nr:hypothetical protein OS493_013697 [Desmophyllum pertusum]
MAEPRQYNPTLLKLDLTSLDLKKYLTSKVDDLLKQCEVTKTVETIKKDSVKQVLQDVALRVNKTKPNSLDQRCKSPAKYVEKGFLKDAKSPVKENLKEPNLQQRYHNAQYELFNQVSDILFPGILNNYQQKKDTEGLWFLYDKKGTTSLTTVEFVNFIDKITIRYTELELKKQGLQRTVDDIDQEKQNLQTIDGIDQEKQDLQTVEGIGQKEQNLQTVDCIDQEKQDLQTVEGIYRQKVQDLQTVEAIDQKEQDLQTVADCCQEIVMGRYLADLNVKTDFMDDEETARWRNHVSIIISFSALLVILEMLKLRLRPKSKTKKPINQNSLNIRQSYRWIEQVTSGSAGGSWKELAVPRAVPLV